MMSLGFSLDLPLPSPGHALAHLKFLNTLEDCVPSLLRCSRWEESELLEGREVPTNACKGALGEVPNH